MVLKRTTVFAEADDLAVIKDAAERKGVPEAEIIREAIHLAALANRTWDEPFFSGTFEPRDTGMLSRDDLLDEVWAEKARAYEQDRDACA